MMQYKVESYPHNDLMNLSFYNMQNIEKKLEMEDGDGIALDCLNCIISLAFASEAIINCIGERCIDKWLEKMPFYKKFNLVCGADNKNNEPYTTIIKLKELRDNLAHPKPRRQVVIMEKYSCSDVKKLMGQPWDDFCSPEFVRDAYEKVKIFECDLLEKYGVEHHDVGTRAISD